MNPPLQLPNGWRHAITADGKVYYVNDITHTTQWNPPIEATNHTVPPPVQIQRPVPIQIQRPVPIQMQPPQVVYIVQDTNQKQGKMKPSKAQTPPSLSSKPRANSIIGEETLAERSSMETFIIIVSMILATVAMLLDLYDFGRGDTDGGSVIMFMVAFMCLVIGCVEYKTGDCECLRDCLMGLTCSYSERKKNAKPKRKRNFCGCRTGPLHRHSWYDRRSGHLLNSVNAILWLVLLGYDVYQMIFPRGVPDTDTDTDTGWQRESVNTEPPDETDNTMYVLKLVITIFGVAVSCISCFFYTAIGKWICRAIVTASIIAVIVLVASQVGA